MFVRIYKNDGKKIEYDHVRNLRDVFEDYRASDLKRYLYIDFGGFYETEPIEDIARIAVKFRSDEFQEGEK